MNTYKIFPYDDLYTAFQSVADYKTIALLTMTNKYHFEKFFDKKLEQYGDCIKTKAWCETVFQVACKKGYMDLAKEIMGQSASTDTTSVDSLNIAAAFSQCCFHNQVEMIKWLHPILETNKLMTEKIVKSSIEYIILKEHYNVFSLLLELKVCTETTIKKEVKDQILQEWSVKFPQDKNIVQRIREINLI